MAAAEGSPSFALPADYQVQGTAMIQQASASVSMALSEVRVEWKGSHIIVTLPVVDDSSSSLQVYMSSPLEDGSGELEDEDDDGDGELLLLDEEGLYSLEEEEEEEEDDDDDEPEMGSSTNSVDVTAVARAINAALEESTLGQAIAERYSIEVTTPGASDELQGDRMFRAYQGFDVICLYNDPKKQNKQKTIQGRLVERNEQHVIINVKGRMSKLIRENVVSVKLPKAKCEK